MFTTKSQSVILGNMDAESHELPVWVFNDKVNLNHNLFEYF